MSKIMEKNLISVDPIPIELLLDILLRLPLKSVARSVCVSKLWQKTIRSDEFIRSYLLRSSPNKLPRLLCALKPNKQQGWCFFTKSAHVLEPLLDLPKPQPLVVKELSLAFSLWCTVSSSSSSLQCTQDHSYAHRLISYVYGGDQIVCNPSTGKYITLPVPLFVTKDTVITSCFLGYDPINGQYKVLCSVFARRLGLFYNQVLTLGTQNCSWRLIQYSDHHPGTRHVCIEGVLYYTAFTNDTRKEQVLVRFDLRSESLEVVSIVPKGFNGLINYHGKVVLVKNNITVFYLRVLEDAKKQKWSNEQLTVPKTTYGSYIEILGTSDMREIVFKNTWFKDIVYFLDQTSILIRCVYLKMWPLSLPSFSLSITWKLEREIVSLA